MVRFVGSGEDILIIGSGGREHALAWKIAQSPDARIVYVAPGNAGTSEGKCRNFDVNFGDPKRFEDLYKFVIDNKIDMVVPGPEAPLAAGIVDFMNEKGYNRIFGPTKAQSLLEASKIWSSKLMEELNIPQANPIICYSPEEMKRAVNKFSADGELVVFKADGLTGGKGARVYDSIDAALSDIDQFFKKYGIKDDKVVGTLVAPRLFGQEYSVFAFCDGKKASALEMAVQDHKRLLDGDKGPNTGGMGAYCPVPIAPREVVKLVEENVMTPVVQKIGFRGFMYAGMMGTKKGQKVIEYNIRFGDPECQPAMMTLQSDLLEHISDCLDGKLDPASMKFKPGAACGVVVSSDGYPEKPRTGFPISGLDAAALVDGVKVFHAGTIRRDDGTIVTAGGRVLCATAYSEDGLAGAKDKAYEAAGKINFEGKYCRKDVADKGLR